MYLMVLLYILNGQAIFEKQLFETAKECVAAGEAKVAALHPESIVLAGSCVQVKGDAS